LEVRDARIPKSTEHPELNSWYVLYLCPRSYLVAL